MIDLLRDRAAERLQLRDRIDGIELAQAFPVARRGDTEVGKSLIGEVSVVAQVGEEIRSGGAQPR